LIGNGPSFASDDCDRKPMNATITALISFTVVLGAGVLGSALRRVVPTSHIDKDSWSMVAVGIGFISTMNAIVLGLLVASAKGSYDAKDADIQEVAADLILLDRTLRQYGPETQQPRAMLHDLVKSRINLESIKREAVPAGHAASPSPQVYGNEVLEQSVRSLSPASDAQHALQTRALQIIDRFTQKRWLFVAQATEGVSTPLLISLVAWLAVIAGCAGLFAPHHATMFAIATLCSLAIAGTIFLIMSMYNPYEGPLRLSMAPLQRALALIEQP
jgi:hypothetical protein